MLVRKFRVVSLFLVVFFLFPCWSPSFSFLSRGHRGYVPGSLCELCFTVVSVRTSLYTGIPSEFRHFGFLVKAGPSGLSSKKNTPQAARHGGARTGLRPRTSRSSGPTTAISASASTRTRTSPPRPAPTRAGPSYRSYVPYHIRFLQVQSVVVPVMASSAATAICHVAVCWALVFKAGMGSRGAAGAEHCHLVLHVCINLAMLALYVRLPAAGRHGRGSPWMRSGSSGDSPSLPYHRP